MENESEIDTWRKARRSTGKNQDTKGVIRYYAFGWWPLETHFRGNKCSYAKCFWIFHRREAFWVKPLSHHLAILPRKYNYDLDQLEQENEMRSPK